MNTVKIAIDIYRLLFPSVNRTCRFDPTCSQYFLKSVEKYGFLKGSLKGLQRILSCHPWTTRPQIDPA